MNDGKTPPGVLPWSRSCFVCGEANPHGLRLRSRLEGGQVVLEHTARDADRGWRHIVHGGISMTLLDEAMTWAAIVRVRAACVAAGMTTRFLRPVQVGERLRVEGEVTGGRSRLILTAGRILDARGQTLVSAEGKYLPMPAEQGGLWEEDFVSGSGSLGLEDLFGRRPPAPRTGHPS